MLEHVVPVIVWTCVVVFVATSLLSLLALIGLIRFGKDEKTHQYYMKKLFTSLIVEVVVAGVGVFIVFASQNYEKALDNALEPAQEQAEASPQVSSETLGEAGELEEAADGPEPRVAPKPRTKTISDKAYASSDGPRQDTAKITIPDGWRYVSHSHRVTTKNENASVTLNNTLPGADGEIEAVELRVNAAGKQFLGPRSWIGVTLYVKIVEILANN